ALLGQLEETASRLPQLDERQRVEQGEADVLGQLELPAVLFQVGGFKAAKVELEVFARKQAFFHAIPIAELDEAAVRQAQFEAEAPLGPLCQIVSQLIAPEIDL